MCNKKYLTTKLTSNESLSSGVTEHDTLFQLTTIKAGPIPSGVGNIKKCSERIPFHWSNLVSYKLIWKIIDSLSLITIFFFLSAKSILNK